jgi:hypothetical protein
MILRRIKYFQSDRRSCDEQDVQLWHDSITLKSLVDSKAIRKAKMLKNVQLPKSFRATAPFALAAACMLAAGSASVRAQTAPPLQRPSNPSVTKPLLEARALDLLRESSARIASSRSLAFNATVGYEYPSRLGPPLLYSVSYEVLMQRPDKLRVLIPGDGPASQFFFDGRTIMAFSPDKNLVAIEPAPPTIEAALKAAFQRADLYFPFSDLLVEDPYRAMTEGVFHAFSIGSSAIIGGLKTNMIALANSDVFLQIWIGANDKLPRRIRAVYAADPLRLRHQLDLSDWRLSPVLPAGSFDQWLFWDTNPFL